MTTPRARSRSTPASRRVGLPAPEKPRTRSAMRTKLATEWMPLEALHMRMANEWAALARRALEPNVFLEPGFALAAARYLERRYSARPAALASKASGQRGASTVAAPDTRPQSGSSARQESGDPGSHSHAPAALDSRLRGNERSVSAETDSKVGNLGAVIVRAGSRLLGLLPGRVEGLRAGRPVPTFVAWTHPFAPLSTPLIDREVPAQVVRAMLEALPSLHGAPRVALFPVVAEAGAVARALAEQSQQTCHTVARLSPFARAVLLPGGGAAARPLPGKRLAELRRQRRRLAEAGKIERLTARGLKEIEPALADYLDLEASGWKGRARSAAQLDPASARFFREAVLALGAEGKAEIDLLRVGGHTIAAAITLYSGDRAWGWKTAYDEGFARSSPGLQLALDLTERLAADRRLALVDSCAMPGSGIMDRVWLGRIAMADWLVPLDGGFSFQAALGAERARRAMIVSAKTLRDLVRRSD